MGHQLAQFRDVVRVDAVLGNKLVDQELIRIDHVHRSAEQSADDTELSYMIGEAQWVSPSGQK